MPYRLKAQAPKKKDLRRLALDQIDKARRTLSAANDPVSDIHETRKCLKRLRSLLRFMQASLSPKDMKREHRRYRDIARQLSSLRDRHVMLTTATHLEAMTENHNESAFAALRQLTVGQPLADGVAIEASEIVAEVMAALEEAGDAMRRVTIRKVSIATLTQGVAASYRDGRTALGHFGRTASCESTHDLRKAVQHHQRHLQLISLLWPEYFDAMVAEARRLAQMLGDHHDLTVLAQFVGDHADDGLTAGQVAELHAAIGARQTDLRTAAAPIARRLFAEKPARFQQRMIDLWRAATLTTKKADPPKSHVARESASGPETPLTHH